jgi:hypothetical protein
MKYRNSLHIKRFIYIRVFACDCRQVSTEKEMGLESLYLASSLHLSHVYELESVRVVVAFFYFFYSCTTA